jgi:hypothetical protein
LEPRSIIEKKTLFSFWRIMWKKFTVKGLRHGFEI